MSYASPQFRRQPEVRQLPPAPSTSLATPAVQESARTPAGFKQPSSSGVLPPQPSITQEKARALIKPTSSSKASVPQKLLSSVAGNAIKGVPQSVNKPEVPSSTLGPSSVLGSAAESVPLYRRKPLPPVPGFNAQDIVTEKDVPSQVRGSGELPAGNDSSSLLRSAAESIPFVILPHDHLPQSDSIKKRKPRKPQIPLSQWGNLFEEGVGDYTLDVVDGKLLKQQRVLKRRPVDKHLTSYDHILFIQVDPDVTGRIRGRFDKFGAEKNCSWIQVGLWGQEKMFRHIAGDPSRFSGKSKLVIVGHGLVKKNTIKIGGFSIPDLWNSLYEEALRNSESEEIASPLLKVMPKKVVLLSCKIASPAARDTSEQHQSKAPAPRLMSFFREKFGAVPSVTAYTTPISVSTGSWSYGSIVVDEGGRKVTYLDEESGKCTYEFPRFTNPPSQLTAEQKKAWHSIRKMKIGEAFSP